jgi:hypothetical protein
MNPSARRVVQHCRESFSLTVTYTPRFTECHFHTLSVQSYPFRVNGMKEDASRLPNSVLATPCHRRRTADGPLTSVVLHPVVNVRLPASLVTVLIVYTGYEGTPSFLVSTLCFTNDLRRLCPSRVYYQLLGNYLECFLSNQSRSTHCGTLLTSKMVFYLGVSHEE